MKKTLSDIPFSIIEKAINEDIEAIDYILAHYRNYIIRLSTRVARDENNNEYNYECQITFKEKYNNNKLLYKSYIKNNSVYTLGFPFDNLIESKEINNKSTKVMSKNNNNANKLASLGYEYDKENDVYFNVDKNNKIEYQVQTEKLVVEKKEKNNSKNIIYYKNTKLINLTISNNKSELLVNLKYNVPLNKMECYK